MGLHPIHLEEDATDMTLADAVRICEGQTSDLILIRRLVLRLGVIPPELYRLADRIIVHIVILEFDEMYLLRPELALVEVDAIRGLSCFHHELKAGHTAWLFERCVSEDAVDTSSALYQSLVHRILDRWYGE